MNPQKGTIAHPENRGRAIWRNKKKKKIALARRFLSLFLILTVILSSITTMLFTPSIAGWTCRVPLDYDTIQDALDDATCEIIEVLPGTYEESLTLTRSVALYAPWGPSNTALIVPDDLTGIEIQASNVLVRGLKVEGASTGIQVAPEPPSGGSISEISLEWLEVLSSSDIGIVFSDASGIIKESWIHDNLGGGLEISEVTDLTVADSILAGNGDAAVNISDSEEISFISSLIENHDIAWRLSEVENIVIRQNLVVGDAGISLVGGRYNLFEENIMELESFGIRLEHGILTTELNEIKDNIMEVIVNGEVAIDLLGTESNIVNDNIILGPWDTGLSLTEVSIGNFEGNVISGPATGVMIDRGDNLVFEGNVIIDGAPYGVRVNEADNVEVMGNVIVGSNLGLATTGEVLNLLVDGNVFSENEVAVRVEGPARSASVSHNVVDSNVLGVDLKDTYEADITYNIVTENTDTGIQVKNSDDVLVANNEIIVGGLAGIRVLDSGSNPKTLIVELNNVSTEVPQPSRDPGGGCPAPEYRLYGIEVRRSNLTIQENRVEDIVHVNSLMHCDSGYGIYVEASEDIPLLKNTVDGYQKFGVLVEESPTYPLSPGEIQEIPIMYNIVVGLGEVYPHAQAGIMVRKGANASLEDNFVGYNWYDGMDDFAIGIGVFEAPYPVNVVRNTIEENQYGIYLWDFKGSTVSSNFGLGNVQGIRVEEADNTLINLNELEGHGGYECAGPPPSIGINIIDSPGVEALSNIMNSHCTGIEAKTSDDVVIRWNNIFESDVVGIHISGGANGIIEENYVALGADGIRVDDYSTYTSVTYNHVKSNIKGIIVDNGFVTQITWNTVIDGYDVGILLTYDGATYVYRNTVTNHGSGIESIVSEAVYIDKNDILENEVRGIKKRNWCGYRVRIGFCFC